MRFRSVFVAAALDSRAHPGASLVPGESTDWPRADRPPAWPPAQDVTAERRRRREWRRQGLLRSSMVGTQEPADCAWRAGLGDIARGQVPFGSTGSARRAEPHRLLEEVSARQRGAGGCPHAW
jgi:hypothetical protein